MSQRTRAHTTGATRKQSKSVASPDEAPEPARKQTSARAAAVAPAAPSGDLQSAPLTPASLARVLRAVATELEQNPAMAERVAQALEEAHDDAPLAKSAGPTLTAAPMPTSETPAEVAPKTEPRRFKPRIVAGAGTEIGTGVPDPFALKSKLGEAGLRRALDDLRLGSLRAIVREHKLDPSGQQLKQNDAQKLRELILRAVR